MLRRLWADSTVYTVAAVVPGVASLGLLPIYTRFLRAEDYGLVDLVTLTYTVVTVIATLEVSQGLARHLPETEDHETRRKLCSTAFWFTTATMLVAVAVMLMIAPSAAPALLQTAEASELLRLGGLTAFIGAMYNLALRQLRWALRPRAYLAVTVLTTVITAAATVICLVPYRLGAAALLLGQAIGAIVGLAFAWRLAGPDLGWVWDREAAKRMLSFSLPLVASTIGVLAAGQASRWIVAHVGSLEAAGLFGVGSRVASILAFAASGVQLSLAPLIYATHRQKKTAQDIASSFRLFSAAALVLWSGLTMFAAEILRVLAAPHFMPAAPLIGPIAAAGVMMTSIMFAPGLEIRHRTGWVAAVSLCAGALNLLLAWSWVAKLGALGAALAMCVSAAVQALLIFSFSQRHYPVPHRWTALLSAVAIAVAATQLVRVAPSLTARAAALLVVAVASWFLLLRSETSPAAAA